MTSWTEIMTLQPLFQVTFILRRPRVANFDDIMKITAIFIRITFKDSKKLKGIRNYALKCNLFMYFLIKQNWWISGKNADVNRYQGLCHVIYTFFGSSLCKV